MPVLQMAGIPFGEVETPDPLLTKTLKNSGSSWREAPENSTEVTSHQAKQSKARKRIVFVCMRCVFFFLISKVKYIVVQMRMMLIGINGCLDQHLYKRILIFEINGELTTECCKNFNPHHPQKVKLLQIKGSQKGGREDYPWSMHPL